MDNYVVISEDRVKKLLEIAGHPQWYIDEYMAANTIPAKELWDAAREDDNTDYDLGSMTSLHYKHDDLTDFLTTKFNNDGE